MILKFTNTTITLEDLETSRIYNLYNKIKAGTKRNSKSYKNSPKTKLGSKRKSGLEHHSPKQEVGYKRDLNFQK